MAASLRILAVAAYVNTKEFPPSLTLCDYLRNVAGLTGTKLMCQEGGCGACMVAVTFRHPVTQKEKTLAVNSCLVSAFSCSQWTIATVEGMKSNGNYNDIQNVLVKENGTQCGYCSAGMVMNMFALQKEHKKNLTKDQIENSFGGNMCRCTGYRPILAAFKKLSPGEDFEMIGDIEDMPCAQKCSFECPSYTPAIYYESDSEVKWYQVFSLQQVIGVFRKFSHSNVRLVAGNTAQGVYADMATSDVCVDINSVAELKTYQLNNNELVLGGNVTITESMEIFQNIARKDANFLYLKKFAQHIDLVAHDGVRNLGTLAGNLMIKNKHNEFPSDVFVLLASVDATLKIVDSNEVEHSVDLLKFLNYDMTNRVIKSILLPALDDSNKVGTYKIMPRAQNAHAMVNAAFVFKMKNDVVKKACIVYGAINPKFVHANASEKYLKDKKLFDQSTIDALFKTLSTEIVPDYVLPDPRPEFRTKLAVSLMYKFILSIAPTKKAIYASGGTTLVRELSEGVQDYKENKDLYPIGASINKLEAYAQVSGEAEYIMDMPNLLNQLWAELVLAKHPPGTKITSVDTKAAKELPGVFDYYSATDIIGRNSFVPNSVPYKQRDPIFCEGQVLYFNQPVGVILAASRDLAKRAAELVEIVGIPPANKPVLTAQQAKSDPKRVVLLKEHKATRKGSNTTTKIKGTCNLTSQYHYHMETQCCVIVPKENDEYDLVPSTQWMDFSQKVASECMNVPMHKINVNVRRLGGAYGAKISRNGIVTCAAFIAAVKTKRPIKMWMTFQDNMNVCGGRNPNYVEYEAEVDNDGIFQSLKIDIYIDTGNNNNTELEPDLINYTILKCYLSDTFNITQYTVWTDKPSHTFARAPGSTEGHAILESIVEHVAYAVRKDPLQVRMNNLSSKLPLLKTFIDATSSWANVQARQKDIEKFNKENRWRKRGLSVVPLAYTLIFKGANIVIVSIYASDGTVAVSHGGIEMGQGINTKAAQVVAHEFGIDMSMVSVKSSNNLVSPNAFVTGASITSEAVCRALQQCCQKLLSAMKVDDNPKEWKTLVAEAAARNIKLTDTYLWTTSNTDENYDIYGVCASEVEFDVLTGNHIVRQVNFLEDTGHSMSPFIDIGQVEGAFIMGMGLWTCEEYVLDKNTGENMTNRTWTYKIPGVKDIPENFYLRFPNNPNPRSPFKTKATAEPPLCLGISVALALRQAIKFARSDAGLAPDSLWYPIDGPCTVEQNFMSTGANASQFKI